jgi:hypothetical protein
MILIVFFFNFNKNLDNILETLGSGSFGTVSKVQDVRPDSKTKGTFYAMKAVKEKVVANTRNPAWREVKVLYFIWCNDPYGFRR